MTKPTAGVVKTKKRSGKSNRIVLGRRVPRTRKLTAGRMEKIKEFLKTVHQHRHTEKYGKMGSDAWVAGLIGSLGERRKDAIVASDVRRWLQRYREFFVRTMKTIQGTSRGRNYTKPGPASICRHGQGAWSPPRDFLRTSKKSARKKKSRSQERPPQMSSAQQENGGDVNVNTASARTSSSMTTSLDTSDKIMGRSSAMPAGQNAHSERTAPVAILLDTRRPSMVSAKEERPSSAIVFCGNVTPVSLLMGTRVMRESLQRFSDEGRANYIDWKVCFEALKTVEMCLDKKVS